MKNSFLSLKYVEFPAKISLFAFPVQPAKIFFIQFFSTKRQTMTTAGELERLYDSQKYENILELARFEPKNPDVIYYAGSVYYKCEDNRKALLCWKEALSLNEDHVPSIRSLAYYYANRDGENYAAAACDFLEKLNHLDEATVDDMIALGELYAKMGDYDAAHYCYIEANELDPDDSMPLLNLAELHGNLAKKYIQEVRKKEDLEGETNPVILALLNIKDSA